MEITSSENLDDNSLDSILSLITQLVKFSFLTRSYVWKDNMEN